MPSSVVSNSRAGPRRRVVARGRLPEPGRGLLVSLLILLIGLVLAAGVAVAPATAQLLPTNPTSTTTTSTVPTTAAPTTVAVTTTAPATTSTASTTTLAPTTTKPADGGEPTTTVASTTTTTNTAPAGVPPTPDAPARGEQAPPPSLPPLARGGGTRVNWAAVVSVTGFAIAFAMLALPGIIQRLERRGPTTTARTRR